MPPFRGRLDGPTNRSSDGGGAGPLDVPGPLTHPSGRSSLDRAMGSAVYSTVRGTRPPEGPESVVSNAVGPGPVHGEQLQPVLHVRVDTEHVGVVVDRQRGLADEVDYWLHHRLIAA